MLYQIFFSPQVKRNMIISNKHGIYELPHELTNDVKPAAGGALPTQEESNGPRQLGRSGKS